MTKIELKFEKLIRKYILPITVIAVSALALGLRYCGRNFISGDYTYFLSGWWSAISQKGVEGLASQVGNYNIPYQIVIFILSRFPINALYAYKLVSVVFDFALAASVGALVYTLVRKNRSIKAVSAYSAVLLLPTVVLNSSFWGQCDSIYVTFIVLGLLFLYREKDIPAFIFFGIAFAFKLQTVFVLPVLIFYWILDKKISIFHFLIIPAVDIAMCLPAVFAGRPLSDIFLIYFSQANGDIAQIQLNYPNLYAFLCDYSNSEYYYLFKPFGILLAVAVLGFMLALFIYKRVSVKDKETFLLTLIWTIFTCLMFLPSMHDRYAYLMDLLCIVYFLLTMKRFWLPCAAVLISLRGYSYYLFKYEDVLNIHVAAILNIILYILVTVILIKTALANTAAEKGTENRAARLPKPEMKSFNAGINFDKTE